MSKVEENADLETQLYDGTKFNTVLPVSRGTMLGKAKELYADMIASGELRENGFNFSKGWLIISVNVAGSFSDEQHPSFSILQRGYHARETGILCLIRWSQIQLGGFSCSKIYMHGCDVTAVWLGPPQLTHYIGSSRIT